MNKGIVIGLTAILAAFAAPLTAGHGGAAGTVEVTVNDYAFDPPILDIGVGTTVRWVNEGPSMHEISFHLHSPVHEVGPHEVSTMVRTDDPGGGGVGLMVMLDAGESFEFTFDVPGVYVVNCNLGGQHDAMKQVIRVTSESPVPNPLFIQPTGQYLLFELSLWQETNDVAGLQTQYTCPAVEPGAEAPSVPFRLDPDDGDEQTARTCSRTYRVQDGEWRDEPETVLAFPPDERTTGTERYQS